MQHCKIWIATDPQKSGAATDTKVRDKGHLIKDAATEWPKGAEFGDSLELSFAGDLDGKEVVRRFGRAEFNSEIIRCEVDILGVGIFTGLFTVSHCEEDSFRKFWWRARIRSSKPAAVRFRPHARGAGGQSE